MTREEAIEEIKDASDTEVRWGDYKNHADLVERRIIAFDMAIKALSQEQKSGRWIEQEGWDGDVYYECSVCGEPFCLIDGTPTDNMYNYCPNCGAKMESEE